MILDKMAGFQALEHFDIRVARSKYVDSAEDAIAFAERRTAPDPRLVPIVLRAVVDTTQGDAKLTAEKHLETEGGIRRAYEALVHTVGTSDRRILAQAATEPGTGITISGETDESLGKTIAVHSAAHVVQRMIPLGTAGVEALALNVQAHHHHGADERTRRMFEHLLEKISSLFEKTTVSRFRLDVRLHGNGYTVLDASLTAPAPLHLKERLGAHAHDRGTEQMHPAGR